MSSALSAAEARLEMAMNILLDGEGPSISIPLALRQLRGLQINLQEIRALAPQRRILDQHIELGYESAQPGATK